MVTTVKYENGETQGEIEVGVDSDSYITIELRGEEGRQCDLSLDLAEATSLLVSLAEAIRQAA